MLKAAAICVLVATLIYALGAFISMEPNVANWSEAGRAVLAWFWLIGSVAANGAALLMKEKDRA